MRETRLPRLVDTYGAGLGAWTGTPTKIAPPTPNLSYGYIPEQAYGAQWRNYLDDLARRQIERGAQVPLRNFLEISSRPVLTATSRACYSRYSGVTFFATSANNSVQYVQDLVEDAGSNAARTLTVTPAAGTFVIKGVEIDDNNEDDPKVLFVGSNSTAPTKTLWQYGFQSAPIEATSPVSGSVELIVADRSVTADEQYRGISNVDHYAFAADTNRSVLKRNTGTGAWTVIGTRGAGAPAPDLTTMYAAAGAGTLVLAYKATNPVVETMSTAGGFTSATVTTLDSGSTSDVRDARYSTQLAQFLVAAGGTVYRFVTPSVKVSSSIGNLGSGGGPAFSCLTDVALAVGSPGASGNGNHVRISSYFGELPYSFALGELENNTTKIEALLYDGNAIWVTTIRSGARRCFRSLRG